MRILYLHQHFTTIQGSSGTRSYEMSRYLLSQGHDVTIVCGSYQLGVTGLSKKDISKGVRRGYVEDIEVIEIDIPYSNYDNFLKRTLKFLTFAVKSTLIALREPCDLVFATSTPLTIAIPGIIAKWLRRKTFVFEVRDLWPELPQAMGVIKNPLILAAMSLLELVAYRSADRCIALAPGIAKGIQRRGVAKEKIVVIPNGSDLQLFQASRDKNLESLRGIKPTDFVAVFSGAHGVANGLDSLLDAACLLQKQNRHDIKLALIGDGKLKPHLVERAKSEGLDNCLFLDPVPKHQLASLLPKANAGLMILKNVPAFYYGTSPNKFFDYIAAGLPVVCNYPGWLSELIDLHDFGVVCSPDDPDALAHAIISIADDQKVAMEMGTKARKLAQQLFSREKLARNFLACLQEALRS
ncbi:MAG: glycosyltransferase family 4 protein [Cyanobacteria bacterium P01_F01_bin.56]